MGGWREAFIQGVHTPGVHRLHSGSFHAASLEDCGRHKRQHCGLTVHCCCVSQDQHLHNFFEYCQSSAAAPQVPGGELVKYLKVKKPDGGAVTTQKPSLQFPEAHLSSVTSQSLHAMESHVMIKFLPTTLNQLFRVLTSATQEDVAVNVTRQVYHEAAAPPRSADLSHFIGSLNSTIITGFTVWLQTGQETSLI